MDEKEVCLQNLSYLAHFSVDFCHFFQHLKAIKFSSLKQQQIYGSVILSRSRTSAILAHFFLIHVVVCAWLVAPKAKWLWRFSWYHNNRQQRLNPLAIGVIQMLIIMWQISADTELFHRVFFGGGLVSMFVFANSLEFGYTTCKSSYDSYAFE